MKQAEQLVFVEPGDADTKIKHPEGWKILLVDDEPAVHDVTLLALKGYEYKGREALFLHAYSAEEARKVFEQHADIAVALVDVVMETDRSGIELVDWIRNEHGNPFVQLILRTGQPGLAPEKEVILNYDINDYKEKTELTAGKLFTLITTSLRSYESLRALDKNRRGLKLIIESSRGLSTHGSIEHFVEGVLTQLQAIFGVEEAAFYCDRVDNESGQNTHSGFLVITGTGQFTGTRQVCMTDIKGSALEQGIKESLLLKQSHYDEGGCYIYFTSANNNHCVLFFNRVNKPLDQAEKQLIDVFCSNINYAFDNLALNRGIDYSQCE